MTEKVTINNFRKLSWDETAADTKELAQRLAQTGKKFQGILAVTRGGLVPAAIIGQELDIRIVESISLVTYSSDNANPEVQETVQIVKAAANVGDGTGWLVVDDLTDTGRSLRALRKIVPQAFFATIYAKPKGRADTDIFVKEFAQDTWLCFPWEKE